MINIHSVRNHLQQNGWFLISDQYTNLDTQLEMKCPQGHIQLQSYAHWRKYTRCEQCIKGQLAIKNKHKFPPPKASNTYRILALDAATYVTGYAVYDNSKLVAYGTYTVNDSNNDKRISMLKAWLTHSIKQWQPDFIGIEDIQLQNYQNNQAQVKTYKTLANLQGVITNTLYQLSLQYELIYCAIWRKICGVYGASRKQQKAQSVARVKSWYGIECSDDQADAICIGKYYSLQNKKKNTWGEKL